MLALCSRNNYRLSEALRRRVHLTEPPGPGGLLGLELEFSARLHGGGRIHFGSLIHRLPIEGEALDPGDPNAYRCSWGGVITSDGAEAEIATPPVWARPGFACELLAWAAAGQAALRRAVPREIDLSGYSAHLSAAMPSRLNDRVCRLYAETFAVGLMLLTDRADSPGLLVRPRPGRIELCGEFIQAEVLSAAAAFVAGSTRACAAAVRGQAGRPVLPPRLTVQLGRAVQRYGWYVDRCAFGTDLHAACRTALLARASGGTISAQSYLELAWAAAREALAGDAATSDVQAVEAMISGSLPLPAERGPLWGCRPGQLDGQASLTPRDGSLPMVAPRLRTHVRPGFTLRPIAVTWDFTVFETATAAQRAYTCVPRDGLPGFLGELEAGALDSDIASYLALRSRSRILAAHRQTRRLGMYDRIKAPAGLLAPERDPQTGRRQQVPLTAKGRSARAGKRNRPVPQPGASRRFSRMAMAIAAALAVLAGAGVIATWLSDGRSAGQRVADPLSPHPGALLFPDVVVNHTVTRSMILTNNRRSPLTVMGLRITGPGRRDFSVRGQHSPGSQPPPCLRHLPPTRTCTIKVAFTPATPGQHRAELALFFPEPQRPQDVTLTGAGSAVTPLPAASRPQEPTSPVSGQPTPSPSTPQEPTTPVPGPPAVTGIHPDTGIATGGTPVTIYGSGFAGVRDVDFGQAPATFTSESSTQITVSSPRGSGVVDVTVITAGGKSAITTKDQFTYQTVGASTSAPPPGTGGVGGG
jgi:hypothetical protein